MSLLRSIHTLLGNAYRARAYNVNFDNQESGAGYYTFEKEKGEGNYVLQESLTDMGDGDPKMPERYHIEIDTVPQEYEPPLAMTAHQHTSISGIHPITYGASANQMITTLPVYNDDHYLKGIFQFRASPRGLSAGDEAFADRMALAQYMADRMSPLMEPRQIGSLTQTRKTLNSIDGAIDFLTGMRDLWQQGIGHWSQETYQHTVRVAELSEMIVRKINEADRGPMANIQMPEKEMRLFRLTAELHDLGKLYTPRWILESGVPVPGVRHELGKQETEIMNRHASDVYDVFDIPGLSQFKKVRDIAGSHHIHANGEGGYPESVRQKLVEEGGVPFEGKVLAISDIFEALTADREYREGVGLPLSTSLRILHSMAKRGQVDPQILRFAIEQSIFEEFSKGRDHISHYDPELYEKLGYSGKDIATVANYKQTIVEETGIARDKLDALLRMSEIKLFDKLQEEERKDDGNRDPAFPTRVQVERLIDCKASLRDMLIHDGNDDARIVDRAYVDKLLALSDRDMEQLAREKDMVAARAFGQPDVEHMEHIISMDISRRRALHMGVSIPAHYPDNDAAISGITGVLKDVEKEKLAQARQAILDDIPAQPLGQAGGKPERFTLFQPQRYTASERSSVAHRG